MRKWILVGLVAFAAAPALAAGSGLKPGLWQTRVVKQVVDGRDLTAQMAGMASRMRQAMANMPAAQRARMEAMMRAHGGASMGAGGSLKMCITPAQARRDAPIIDHKGQCRPATVTHSGNRTTFTIHCSSNGNTTTGKGETTAVGNVITSQIDVTTHMANGKTNVMHTEAEMKYLGPDCGDVKPLTMPKASR